MASSSKASSSAIRSFRKDLRALERQVELSLASQTECCGVTQAQCYVLLEVAGGEEPSVGELAEALELDASTLSRAVDNLVRLGLLERGEDPANRRRYLVNLSATGRMKVAEIDELCDAYYEGFLSSFSKKDRDLVLEMMPRFIAALRTWRLSGTAPGCHAGPAEESK